jgi:hypothetical protein
MLTEARNDLCLKYQSVAGSLNWLAHTTRPDISTAVSLPTQNQSDPSNGHLKAANYVARYLANTKTLGIYFTSCWRATLESFSCFTSYFVNGRCELRTSRCFFINESLGVSFIYFLFYVSLLH